MSGNTPAEQGLLSGGPTTINGGEEILSSRSFFHDINRKWIPDELRECQELPPDLEDILQGPITFARENVCELIEDGTGDRRIEFPGACELEN